MTKFTTFVHATCFVNSFHGGMVGHTIDHSCDHIVTFLWISPMVFGSLTANIGNKTPGKRQNSFRISIFCVVCWASSCYCQALWTCHTSCWSQLTTNKTLPMLKNTDICSRQWASICCSIGGTWKLVSNVHFFIRAEKKLRYSVRQYCRLFALMCGWLNAFFRCYKFVILSAAAAYFFSSNM